MAKKNSRDQLKAFFSSDGAVTDWEDGEPVKAEGVTDDNFDALWSLLTQPERVFYETADLGAIRANEV